jgi:hypothetical protein
MALDALETIVRDEINASLADFDFDPAPRVVAALQRAGFVIAVGIPTTTEEKDTI